MARIRHERARVCDHADESRQQARIRKRLDLPVDAVLLIEEPPCAAVLNLPRRFSILEASDQAGEWKGVGRIEL